eukprot:scaffold337298_cov20-Prasinocladus_malaysianus.AAC.1
MSARKRHCLQFNMPRWNRLMRKRQGLDTCRRLPTNRSGSHPLYLPARMNTSASTTLRAAANVRAAASSAVVSVSTPCAGRKTKPPIIQSGKFHTPGAPPRIVLIAELSIKTAGACKRNNINQTWEGSDCLGARAVEHPGRKDIR